MDISDELKQHIIDEFEAIKHKFTPPKETVAAFIEVPFYVGRAIDWAVYDCEKKRFTKIKARVGTKNPTQVTWANESWETYHDAYFSPQDIRVVEIDLD